MVYAIYEEFFEDVKKKLNRISKKCAKNGNPFKFNIIREEIRKVETKNDCGKVIKVDYYKFIIVEVDGTAKIDNWECVATLEITSAGNIIKRINTEMDIPQRFWTSENICEHCNTRRQRNKLYIIHNVKTGDFKQVGKNCLLEYTNGLNAEYVTGWIDGITELEEYDGFIGGGSHKRYFDIKDVLGYATELINKVGYFNSSVKGVATRTCVDELLTGNGTSNDYLIDRVYRLNKRFHDYHYDNVALETSDFNKEETSKKVEKIIEYYKGLNDDGSEFLHNIKVFLEIGFVDHSGFGYICYLPQGYDKYIQREIARAERTKANKASNYYGVEKKRYKDVKAIIFDCLYTYSNQWGVGYIYRITLENGEQLIWKTSKDVIDMISEDTGIDYDEVEMDKYIIDTLTFTVKSHSEYKGTKQTEITRAVTHWRKRHDEPHPDGTWNDDIVGEMFESLESNQEAV